MRRNRAFLYGLGCFGQNMLWYLLSNFTLIFYTDFAGLSAAAAGTLLLAGRLFDAFNDPAMGIIADRRTGRSGRFRPFLIQTPILLIPLSALLFSQTLARNIIFAYAAFFVFDLVYTASDVPYWALGAAAASSAEERTEFGSAARGTAAVATALAALLTVPLLEFFGNSFAAVGILYATLTAICFAVTFFGIHEKTTASDEDLSENSLGYKALFATVFRNRPLLITAVASLFMGIATGSRLILLPYYANHVLGSPSFYTLIAGLNVPFMLLGIALAPRLSGKFGKKKTYLGYVAVYALFSLLFYFGEGNPALLVIFSCLSSLGMGAPAALTTAFLGDSVDYAESLTGTRSEGLVLSSQTFVSKISSALASAAVGFALASFGYVSGIPAGSVSGEVLSGIHALTSFLPFGAAAAAGFVMSFHPNYSVKRGEKL